MTVCLEDSCDYDELVYVLSHDLQAPARALRQYVMLINMEPQDGLTDTARRFLGRLDTVLDRMDEHLNNLLSLSRITKTTPVPPNGVDLGALTATALETAGIPGEVSPGLPRVALDSARAEWLSTELVGNVAAHAGPDARLDLGFEDGAFVFRDNGAGIPERLRDEVFMVFRPVSRPETGHAGMGLSRLSRLVRSLGGKVWITLPEAGGCAVHLRLPLARPERPSTPASLSGLDSGPGPR